MAIATINPASGETVKTYDEMPADQVTQAIEDAHAAFLEWRRVPFAERAKPMRRAAELLRERTDEFGRLMAQEMGKAIREGRAEAQKCAWVCDFYAEHAERFLQPEVVETDATRSFVSHQPIGVVLAVMPWNFPFWQVFRFAAPALMAGNAGLLKHASNVPGCALAIEKVLHDAGFPPALFRALLIGSGPVASVIDHPRVMAATLTGSTFAGQAVASRSGHNIKKTVLELGGSDPYVILEDADLDVAIPACVTAKLINSGQTCIAAKRFVVVESVRDQFEQRFVEALTTQKMGDPLEEDTIYGPQASNALRADLHKQVELSIAKGARLILGGEIPAGEGAYYPATVLTDVKPGMPAYHEELFGPVANIIAVKDEAEAIRVANDSVFGLGAAVFTRDVERGTRIAEQELQAGLCFVNSFVKSDPRLPFGGVKESGYGRELSHQGIKEFVNIKTVWVK